MDNHGRPAAGVRARQQLFYYMYETKKKKTEKPTHIDDE